MVKLKRSPKTRELDISVAKNGQLRILPRQAAIPWQMANSTAQRENLCAAEYCWH